MKNLGLLSFVVLLALGSLMLSGCKEAITADQQAELEETRVSTEQSEKDLSVKRKERLQLEAEVKQGEK